MDGYPGQGAYHKPKTLTWHDGLACHAIAKAQPGAVESCAQHVMLSMEAGLAAPQGIQPLM